MESVKSAKKLLDELKNKPKHEKMLLFSGIFTELLEQEGIRPIIVGGLSVEIYTRGDYTTRDIDFVFPGRQVADRLLSDLEFTKQGRHWYHSGLELAIEVPDDFLDGDEARIIKFNLENAKHIYVIGVEDIILDRLRACVHWQSTSDCEWAIRLMLTHNKIIDFAYLKNKSVADKTEVKLTQIINKYLK